MQRNPGTKDKASMRQLAMLYIITGFSPAIRFLPSFAAKVAKEAGWASPFMAVIPIGLNIFFFHRIFSKTKDKSTFEVINDILGKFAGSFVIFLHLIWTILLLALNIRLHGERLISTVFPNINVTFFIVITLIVTSVVLRSGATAIARMGEFLTPILVLLFTFVSVFLLPNIREAAVLPVYFNDITPMFKASFGTLYLFSFGLLIFMVSPQITNKKGIAKILVKAALVYYTMIVVLLLMSIGILGSLVAAKASNPFLIIVKQISILDTIENIESVVIAMWLLSDSMSIIIMSTVTLNIMKHLFKLSDQKNLINILFVFMYIASLGTATNRLEIDLFSTGIFIYVSAFFGFAMPFLLYVVGKIRRKI